MSDNVPTKACWNADDARTILHIEALEGASAAFKATHIPIRGFEVRGPFGNEIASSTEQSLLDALSVPNRRHAFCVVEGEPGSGKSHLVRWLAANWPDSDRPFLIQRLDSSLEGALRQLQDRLPPEFANLFDRVGQRQRASLEGRSALFLSNLTEALKPNFFEKPLPDVDWCKKFDPTSLLYNKRVRDNWSAPQRVLRLMLGADGDRNSAEARFDVTDVAQFAEYEPFIKDTIKTIQLVRKIKHEAQFVRDWIAAGKTSNEIERTHKDDLPATLALVDALNRRRNYAVQAVLGITGEGLKQLFRELRQALKKQDQRLVLLLEDVTSWQGIDDSLVDALVTNAETREADGHESELCDLISVVGVTPNYLDKLPSNYQQRVTHHISLGKKSGPLQDVASLRDPDSQVAFVARYLAAARVGQTQLEAWAQRVTDGQDIPPPNQCKNCPFQAQVPCHAAFGAHEEVGLFPFTRVAITRLFNELKEADGNMTWKTPRGIIQGILAPTLTQPELIEAGHYPGPEIETTKLEPNAGNVFGLARTKIEAVASDVDTRERLRRVVAFWGDKNVPQTRVEPNGTMTFATVPRAIFDAFHLPWLGDLEPSTTAIDTWTSPEETKQDSGTKTEKPKPQGPKPEGPSTAKPPSLSAVKLRQMLDEIANWRNGQELQNPTNWNRLLAEVVREEVDFSRLGIERWLSEKLFTPATIQIKGTGRTDSRHYVVPATEWLIDGLEAVAALKSKAIETVEQEEFYRRRYAHFLRQLADSIVEFAAGRRPKLDDGSHWNYVATAVQILLTRTWLRGSASPTAPMSAQWRALLNPESEPTTAPEVRTTSWSTIVETTANSHEKFRELLKGAVSLPQGGSQEFGIADAGLVASAVIAMRESIALLPVPKNVPETPNWMSDLSLLANVARRVTERLPGICSDEGKLLNGKAKRLMEMLRGRGINAHAARVNSVLDRVTKIQPSASPVAIQQWRHEQKRLPEKSVLEGLQVWLMKEVDETRTKPNDAAAQLEELCQAPAGDLNLVYSIIGEGEKAVATVLQFVEASLARDGQGESSIETIHEAGSKIVAAVARARSSEKTKP